MRKRMTMIGSLGILCGMMISLLLLTVFLLQTNRSDTILRGQLDLSSWTAGQPVNLDGEWAFYWDRILMPGPSTQTDEKPTGFISVPSDWNRQKTLSLPSIGQATYHLNIRLPDDLQSLALIVPRIYTEYSLWANGWQVVSNGLAPGTRPAYLSPRLVRIDQLAGELNLVLQVRNTFHVHAGIGQSLRIGTFDDLYRERTLGLAFDLAIVAVCAFTGLYHLMLFLFKRHSRAFGCFAMLCLTVGFRSLLNNQNFILFLWPDLSFNAGSRLMSLTIPLIVLSVVFYLRALFRSDIPDWLFRTLTIFSLSYLAAVLVLPNRWYLILFDVYLVSTIAVCLLMIYLSVLSLVRRNEGALIFATGTLLMVTGALYDTLYYYQLINTGIYLSIGLAGFAGTQTLLLALNHSRMEHDRQSLKQQLLVTDLSYLRAQIKPHFIYNALATISSTISRNPAEAKSLLLDFSDFLRGCFSVEREDGLTTLASELNTVRAYLSLEKARFRGRLQVVFDLAEDESRLVPILSLQPIVENAVRHGLMPKVDGGTVKIRTWQTDGQTHILVEDDGVGMQVNDRHAPDQDQTGSGNGIGLQNINRRLDILYGTRLHIDSRPGQGTRIEMILPADC